MMNELTKKIGAAFGMAGKLPAEICDALTEQAPEKIMFYSESGEHGVYFFLLYAGEEIEKIGFYYDDDASTILLKSGEVASFVHAEFE